MLRATAFAIALLCATASNAADFPQMTCPVVRDYVAQYGRVNALRLALEHGATWAQIREAMKCLRK